MMIVVFVYLFVCCSSAVEVKRPRGVSLTKRPLYDETKNFTCLDGSKSIPFDQVNDDYCDCPDGTDEPGTAACPNGFFHCTNAGFRPQNIHSSLVNDGICDCCDTTDEYNSGVVCENSCKDLGRKEHELLAKQAEVAAEGFKLKQQLIEEGKKNKEDKQRKIEGLREAKKDWEIKVSELRTFKEEAEVPEKAAKEKHHQEWEDLKEAKKQQEERMLASTAFAELDDDGDGLVTVSEVWTHVELDMNSDGTFTEDEAWELLGGASSVDHSGFLGHVWSKIKDKYNFEVHPVTEKPEEDREMPPYDEATQGLIDVADKARADLSEVESSMRSVEADLKDLEKELSLDLGRNGEFAYMYGKCFEMTTPEYIYRICPFNKIVQKPKSGGTETSLGSWGMWVDLGSNNYSQMKYDRGTACWQGPNRSTLVKLTCGRETVVTSTVEPSRCEYAMEMQTPALCQEPRSQKQPGDEWQQAHSEL
uniref:glucosidase 2 subunit beta isoform X3 n=1 Tax=Myxine glutinosa TaxID=7769 RepID=UPI00358ECB6E